MSDLPAQLVGCTRVIDHRGNTHYTDPATGFLVASIIINNRNIFIKADMGDEVSIPFSFTHSGPMAVVYCDNVTIDDLNNFGDHTIVCAMMSFVTFATISTCMQIHLNVARYYDVGDIEMYAFAQDLICYHTHKEWDDEFLFKIY